MTSFGKRRVGTQVQLNVYDLSPANEVLHHAGLGFYHTGVEILGVEYTFAHTAGIFSHTPRAVPNAKFREKIDMGHFDGGGKQVQDALADLGSERYGPYDYDILKANCNHFATALCFKLLKKITPGYINRAADIGRCLSCLIPKKLLENSPVNAQQDSSASEAPAYTVKAPVNRRMNDREQEHKHTIIDPSKVFAGTGNILGSTTTSSIITGSSSSTNTDTLTDRREKARAAALARLERSSNSNTNTNNNNNTQSLAN